MNINYTQVIKKQTQIIALSVFVMVIGILGVSYALFMKVDQSEEQTVQSGSLIMQLSAYDGSTVITDNNTPIDDNEGLLSKGYSFSVTNNGTLPITYYIALYDNPDDTSTNKVNYDYIKMREKFSSYLTLIFFKFMYPLIQQFFSHDILVLNGIKIKDLVDLGSIKNELKEFVPTLNVNK